MKKGAKDRMVPRTKSFRLLIPLAMLLLAGVISPSAHAEETTSAPAATEKRSDNEKVSGDKVDVESQKREAKQIDLKEPSANARQIGGAIVIMLGIPLMVISAVGFYKAQTESGNCAKNGDSLCGMGAALSYIVCVPAFVVGLGGTTVGILVARSGHQQYENDWQEYNKKKGAPAASQAHGGTDGFALTLGMNF